MKISILKIPRMVSIWITAILLPLILVRMSFSSPVDTKDKQIDIMNMTEESSSTTTLSNGEEDLGILTSPMDRNLGGKMTTHDKLVLEYVCMPEPGPCPTLKHYQMYALEPEDEFYPSWTYYGFYPPLEWHTVPIKYFEEPPPKVLNGTENYDIRKHGSAMYLCTEDVTNDIEKCKARMENECINSVPSPINILSKEAVEDPSLRDMAFINYNTFFGFEMFFETDGSQLLFVKFLPFGKDQKMPGIRKGPLFENNQLFLDRIIIRVGTRENLGSEHSLDGKYFGMELQFFFTADNLPYWQILSQYKILPQNDTSVGHRMHVVSLFVQVAPYEKNPPDGSPFAGKAMEILSFAAGMFWKGENKNLSSTVRVEKKVLTLEDFFDGPTQGIYYTYQGSLTHPPCLTNVGWTVFEKPIWIPHKQWRRFADVHAEYSDHMFLGGNLRPQDEILVKAPIDMYINMKKMAGYGELRQSELDEAGENSRRSILNPMNESSSPFELYLIRKYEDYQTYFARRVRKRHNRLDGTSNLDEFDYYDVKSNAMVFHLWDQSRVFRTFAGVVAVWVTATRLR